MVKVPALRFPEFTGEWKEERLDEIAELSKGVGISKEQLSEDGEPCILYGELYTKYKSEIIHKVISKTNHCCPEKFYHKVGCSTEPVSGTLTGVVG